MNTLIIYDLSGRVISQISGMYEVPNGIPYMELEVPAGKYVSNVDVTKEPHEPVFVDLPNSELDLLKEKQDLMQAAIDDLILGGAL